MQMRHQFCRLAVGPDQLIAHVAGMAGRIAQSLDAFDPRQPSDQLRQAAALAARGNASIGIDILTEQRELAGAVVGELPRLRLDLRHRARVLGPARVGYHTERTEFVAALLHGQKGGGPARLGSLRQARKFAGQRKGGLHHRRPVEAGTRHQFGQAMIALRSHDDIDQRRPPHDFRALGLGDAASDRDHRRLSLSAAPRLDLPYATEIGVDLLDRLLADVSGVEDDEVGIRHGLAGRVAGLGQGLADALRILDVHLAAERLDEHLLRCGHLERTFAIRGHGWRPRQSDRWRLAGFRPANYLRPRFKGTPNSSKRWPTRVKTSSRATRSCRRSISSLRNSMTLPLSISIK